MKKKWFAMITIMLIFALVLGGCGKSNNTGSSTTTQSDSKNQAQFNWKMQAVYSVGQGEFKLLQQAAADVELASGGRLKIEVVPNGTLASSMESFQACGDGVFEMNASWPLYLKGLEYAFIPISGGALSMDVTDKYVWMYEYGGLELAQKAFDKVNLQLVGLDIVGSEVMMSNKPFKNIKDMEGSKMRISDARLVEKNGIAGITLPLEEIFTAMATGSVDCIEFQHLKYNQNLGLTDISKYGIYPDFWNIHNLTSVVVNKDAWNSLPSDLQKIVEMCFKSYEIRHWTKSQYESAVTMKELQKENKMEFLKMDKKPFAKLRSEMYEIEQEDIAKHGGLTKEVLESQYEFMKTWYPYKDMSSWWGEGLTPEEQMGFDSDNK